LAKRRVEDKSPYPLWFGLRRLKDNVLSFGNFPPYVGCYIGIDFSPNLEHKDAPDSPCASLPKNCCSLLMANTLSALSTSAISNKCTAFSEARRRPERRSSCSSRA